MEHINITQMEKGPSGGSQALL